MSFETSSTNDDHCISRENSARGADKCKQQHIAVSYLVIFRSFLLPYGYLAVCSDKYFFLKLCCVLVTLNEFQVTKKETNIVFLK